MDKRTLTFLSTLSQFFLIARTEIQRITVHSVSLALRGTTKANRLKEQFRNFVTLCISLIFCALNL